MAKYEEHEVAYGDNKSIFYNAAGAVNGPLIIFMHGWPGIGKTWHDQIDAFAALGFRVVAPDMPGYGRSTARKDQADYSQEIIVQGMLALLADTGRTEAIWVAHDWGCGTLWSLANVHPEVCRAVVGLAVPYRTAEMGLENVLKLVNRDLYPEDEYPYGQWSYMEFYRQSFDKALEWMDKDIPGFLKAILQNGNPATANKVAPLANIVRDGGWFGGSEKPPSREQIPDGNSNVRPDIFEELVEAMQKTSFYGGNSWYMHHEANAEYNIKQSKHEGRLKMPVLFIHARYDSTCQSVVGRLAEPMRKYCDNLSEAVIEAGHWVGVEKPEETNAVMARWLVEEVKDWWPGFWANPLTKNQGGNA